MITSLLQKIKNNVKGGFHYAKNKTIYIIKDVFFVFLGINAFKGKDIKVPFVDSLLAKYM